jgi:hypothetical protein
MRPAPLFLCLLPLLAYAAARKPPHAPDTPDVPVSREVRGYHSGWDEALEDYRKGRFERAARKLEGLAGGDSLASLYRSVLLAQSPALVTAPNVPSGFTLA